MVPRTGIEPVRPLFTKAGDFKSPVSTYFTTWASNQILAGFDTSWVQTTPDKRYNLGMTKHVQLANTQSSDKPSHPVGAQACHAALSRVVLIGKYGQTQHPQAFRDIAAFLNQTCEVVYTELNAETIAKVDAVIVVGGDGTLLLAAREVAHSSVPLIGINQGHLGFMTDIALTAWREPLSAMLAGHYDSENRMMIAGEVWRDGQIFATGLALNDAVVSRSGLSLADYSVFIDSNFAYRVRADGLIVATPTGSTAYALSANGPIMHPSVAGLLIAPVAPQTLSNRPIVVSDAAKIVIRIESDNAVSMAFDMFVINDLQRGDEIHLHKSNACATLLHPLDYDYYYTLRQKLHWTYNPIQTQ